MTMTDVAPEIKTLEILKEQKIDASIDLVFETILEELGPNSVDGAGKPMSMKIEPFPGGRWYRDLGNNNGHFWGTVQVIKPPTLIELSGPMFMSYPAINHVQYRLKADGKATQLSFAHRAFGLLAEEHMKGVRMGWDQILQRIVKAAEKR